MSTQQNIITIASSSNETYAMGLAVSLYSLIDHLPADSLVDVLILDGGLKTDTWNKVETSLKKTNKLKSIRRLLPEMAQFEGLPRDWGSSTMTYARLALPDLCEAKRVLYLDSDMVVQADATVLWTLDLKGNTVAACRDVITKTLGAEGLPLSELYLPPEDPYMQAGLMVMDLELWRKQKISSRALQYIKEYPHGAKYWDQSALNVVLHGKWLQLPDEWNTPAWWADAGREQCSLDAPLLHYVGPHKPWLLGHAHSQTAKRFYNTLDKTVWKGWRPSRSAQLLKQVKYRVGRLLGK